MLRIYHMSLLGNYSGCSRGLMWWAKYTFVTYFTWKKKFPWHVIWISLLMFFHSSSEFSESLKEMGSCLLEKTALVDNEEFGERPKTLFPFYFFKSLIDFTAPLYPHYSLHPVIVNWKLYFLSIVLVHILECTVYYL